MQMTLSSVDIFQIRNTLGNRQRLDAFTSDAALVCNSVITLFALPSNMQMLRYKASTNTCID